MSSSENETVAVVTGGARGFGLEIATRLIARGHTVLVTDLDQAAVDAAVATLGPRARGRVADAADAGAHRETAAAAAGLGQVGVWVNNAGVAWAAKSWEHPEREVELTVTINLLGVIHGSRAAVEVMRASGGGHILNIGSMSSFGPVPGLAVYAATKAAVLSFTTSLQGDLDLAGIPIRAHVLCPDAADTAMVRGAQSQPDAAILFSGWSLLDPGKVADAAIELLDGNRIVKAMPSYRAAMSRAGALVPTAGLRAMRLLRLIGERTRVKEA